MRLRTIIAHAYRHSTWWWCFTSARITYVYFRSVGNIFHFSDINLWDYVPRVVVLCSNIKHFLRMLLLSAAFNPRLQVIFWIPLAQKTKFKEIFNSFTLKCSTVYDSARVLKYDVSTRKAQTETDFCKTTTHRMSPSWIHPVNSGSKERTRKKNISFH